MSECVAYITIYYNDNENTFEDEDGDESYDISEIMDNDQIMSYKKDGGTCYHRIGNDIDGQDFEVVFPTRPTDRTLYYDIKENVMYDENGHTAYNIFNIITPNELYLFKHKKETMDVAGVHGGSVELIWPNPINY
jgi:hypothetical protein